MGSVGFVCLEFLPDVPFRKQVDTTIAHYRRLSNPQGKYFYDDGDYKAKKQLLSWLLPMSEKNESVPVFTIPQKKFNPP
jgi:protein involved in sex pheromone biosynthesis